MWLLMLEKPKIDTKFHKTSKIANFVIKKNIKNCVFEILKNNSLHLETVQ